MKIIWNDINLQHPLQHMTLLEVRGSNTLFVRFRSGVNGEVCRNQVHSPDGIIPKFNPPAKDEILGMSWAQLEVMQGGKLKT